MDRDKIINVLEKEESNKLEFKERFSNSILKTISAFANTYGGLIIVGVNNRREVAGIDADDRNYQRILNTVINKLGITPDFELINVQNKSILAIEVKKSYIPVSFEGRYYKRVGNTTREMNFEELKRFFQRDLRWERLSERGFKIDEIDENSVRSFLRAAKAKGRLTVFNLSLIHI